MRTVDTSLLKMFQKKNLKRKRRRFNSKKMILRLDTLKSQLNNFVSIA